MNYNLFLKRPLYYSAGAIRKIMKNVQDNLDKKNNQKNQNAWNSLFHDNAFFQYLLTDDIKINLYKNSVLSKLIHEGFEKEELNYLQTVLKKDDIFIDVGANIGLFSLLASKIVGENGQVICFEPAPDTFIRLIENTQINRFLNIDCRNIGLSNQIGKLTFHVSKNGHDAWNSFAPSKDDKLESTVQVPVSTLDFELENINKERIKLVKIDVEGWEKFVLHGGEDFFTKFNPIVMVEFTEENTFNAGYPVHDIYDIMEKWNYIWYRIIDGKPIKESKKLYYPYDNLVAIKNSKA